jgi:hypothetical protein
VEDQRGDRRECGLRLDEYANTISLEYLKEIHECYEDLVGNWRATLLKYQEFAVVPPDSDMVSLPAEIDMHDHPDYVHVAAGTIREKVRKMVTARRSDGSLPICPEIRTSSPALGISGPAPHRRV